MGDGRSSRTAPRRECTSKPGATCTARRSWLLPQLKLAIAREFKGYHRNLRRTSKLPDTTHTRDGLTTEPPPDGFTQGTARTLII
jgi:hypothetical protein